MTMGLRGSLLQLIVNASKELDTQVLDGLIMMKYSHLLCACQVWHSLCILIKQYESLTGSLASSALL